ncbi:Syntaxin-8 [Candida viswanathii]|uniref:Syntaxin-8 n=1 Tax=Candida viswanathii TaxID=5486 RepID=A0A367XZH6_9ASCO|nr:Syntaxin-8 [Candida viswanathii]
MTSKDTRLTVSKIRFNLEELGNLLEERTNLNDLDLTPSKNDNFELISLILKTIQYFKFVDKDITNLTDFQEKEHLGSEFETLVEQYNEIYSQLSEDSNLDISEYKYTYTRSTSTATATTGDTPANNNVHKSVRFKDTPDDNDASELMGTRHAFKPYKDDPDEEESSSPEDVSNHQMFAQHQQTMMRQDQDLDTLHLLISRQYMMGQDINHELDDQLIILNDLELGVDQSLSRMDLANRRIRTFRNLMRENGSLVTICTLSIILILLLVVLN